MPNAEYCFVSELQPAMRIDQVFLVSQPQLRTTSRGDYYIAAFLGDKTGKLNGRMWQATETLFKSLPEEGFVRVKGRTENYQGALQLVIEGMQPVDVSDVTLDQFMPSSERDAEEMFGRVQEILSGVSNVHLVQLAKAFLADEELMKLFKNAPAAIALHHAYLGGLLEHTLSVMELGNVILPLYPQLDSDLVLTALFLHDIGKTVELDYDISFKYSDQGRLLGHLVKGVLMIEEKIAQFPKAQRDAFPAVLQDSLLHIIVSHHGMREYGCPVMPATPEAYAVHYMDNLDSKMSLTFSQMQSNEGSSRWTNFVRALDSALFKVRPNEE